MLSSTLASRHCVAGAFSLALLQIPQVAQVSTSAKLRGLGRRIGRRNSPNPSNKAGGATTPWDSSETPWSAEDSLHGTYGDLQEGESRELQQWEEAEHYSLWTCVTPRDRHWRGRTNHYHNHFDGRRTGHHK